MLGKAIKVFILNGAAGGAVQLIAVERYHFKRAISDKMTHNDLGSSDGWIDANYGLPNEKIRAWIKFLLSIDEVPPAEVSALVADVKKTPEARGARSKAPMSHGRPRANGAAAHGPSVISRRTPRSHAQTCRREAPVIEA